MLSLAMDKRSSWLLVLLGIPLLLVKGVLRPFTEPVGVDMRLEGLVLEAPAAFFAALSCSRFCLDAEGAMIGGVDGFRDSKIH